MRTATVMWMAVLYGSGVAASAGPLAGCRARPRNWIVLCAGDSLTERGWPAHLDRALGRAGLSARVYNMGRSGHTSGEYLRFLRSERSRFAAARPDFVLLALGTNDVRIDADATPREAFRANLREIAAELGRLESRFGRPPRLVVATAPPIPAGEPFPFGPDSDRRIREEINPEIKALARELGVPVADQHALFSAAPGLLPAVHPSEEGYRRMGETWLDILAPAMRGHDAAAARGSMSHPGSEEILL